MYGLFLRGKYRMLLTNIYTVAFCGLLVIGFLFRKNETAKKESIIDLWFCIAVALIAATFFTLFPLTKLYTYADSSVFIYIGKMMRQGLVPYRDLFDHKGILLYFIQYLGVSLCSDSFLGIWVLEVLHMVFTVWFLFKLSGMFSDDKVIRYISVIGVAVMCGMNTYEGGNFTEEYALPWIAFALYVFLKYFKNFSYRFYEIVCLGVGFAVVSLLRVNMVTVWIAFMPLVLIRMLYKRENKELLNCIVGFCIGIFLIYIPTLIYMLWNGCLKDFIECYILFNFGYSDGGSNFAAVTNAITECIRNLFWAFVAGIAAIFSNRKNKLFWLDVWVLVVTLYFSHMSGRFYQHYGMILLPMLLPLVTGAITTLYMILSLDEKIAFKMKLPGNKIMAGCFFLAVLAAFFLQFKWANLIREPMFQTGGVRELQEYLIQNTTQEDDVLIVGNDAKYYLLANRHTNNKYFYQTPPIKISNEIYQGFIEELERCLSDTIVVMGNKNACLERGDNLGQVYHYFEEQALQGKYHCQEFENYYIYTKEENK